MTPLDDDLPQSARSGDSLGASTPQRPCKEKGENPPDASGDHGNSEGWIESGGQDANAVVPTWSEFTQNTTFHGVKYMFEDTSRKTRK